MKSIMMRSLLILVVGSISAVAGINAQADTSFIIRGETLSNYGVTHRVQTYSALVDGDIMDVYMQDTTLNISIYSRIYVDFAEQVVYFRSSSGIPRLMELGRFLAQYRDLLPSELEAWISGDLPDSPRYDAEGRSIIVPPVHLLLAPVYTNIIQHPTELYISPDPLNEQGYSLDIPFQELMFEPTVGMEDDFFDEIAQTQIRDHYRGEFPAEDWDIPEGNVPANSSISIPNNSVSFGVYTLGFRHMDRNEWVIFEFDIRQPTLDGNILRVATRVYWEEDDDQHTPSFTVGSSTNSSDNFQSILDSWSSDGWQIAFYDVFDNTYHVYVLTRASTSGNGSEYIFFEYDTDTSTIYRYESYFERGAITEDTLPVWVQF